MTEIIEATAGIMPHALKLKLAQERMKDMPQTFCPVREYFGHGMYTRVVFIPAGTAVIGKRHLHGQHNFLMHGTIELATENGPVRLHAPDVIVSDRDTKRAAIAITDVIWATTIPTDLADSAEIERQFIAPEDCTAEPRVTQEGRP
jgi:hypothetical protein